jgi:hypothetical protein
VSADHNKIAKLEKAIKTKYGDEAVRNPLSNWDEGKEEEYIEQIKEVAAEEKERQHSEKEYYSGFFVDKKLLSKESNRICPVCNEYTFDLKDDVYLNKWESCHKCYIQWIEGRESRWKSGWKPGDKNVGK